MSMKQEEIIEAVGAMTVMELNELVKTFEEKFGVSAAAMAVAAPGSAAAGTAGSGAGEEQSEFSVTLTAAGDKKVEVIKVVRSITGLGLKEAKEIVDAAPKAIKEGIAKAEAEALVKQLEEAGASVEMK